MGPYLSYEAYVACMGAAFKTQLQENNDLEKMAVSIEVSTGDFCSLPLNVG